MNLEHFLSQILQLTANFDPRTAALLFLICAIGEFGVSVPYVLESVWLLAGYQLGSSVLSPVHLVGFWLAAQCGRQVGSIALFSVVRLSSSPLAKLYRKCTSSRFWPRVPVNTKVFTRINLTSPFSIGYGRLMGLRIPLTLTLSVNKHLKTLSLGVLLSSLAWDTAAAISGLS